MFLFPYNLHILSALRILANVIYIAALIAILVAQVDWEYYMRIGKLTIKQSINYNNMGYKIMNLLFTYVIIEWVIIAVSIAYYVWTWAKVQLAYYKAQQQQMSQNENAEKK